MKKAKGADDGDEEFVEEWTGKDDQNTAEDEEKSDNKDQSDNADDMTKNSMYCRN